MCVWAETHLARSSFAKAKYTHRPHAAYIEMENQNDFTGRGAFSNRKRKMHLQAAHRLQ